METLELKLSLIEQLKSIDDKNLLMQIKKLISRSTVKEEKEERLPAQMTLDELKEVLKKSIEESKMGLGMTTEELRKRHPLCK